MVTNFTSSLFYRNQMYLSILCVWVLGRYLIMKWAVSCCYCWPTHREEVIEGFPQRARVSCQHQTRETRYCQIQSFFVVEEAISFQEKQLPYPCPTLALRAHTAAQNVTVHSLGSNTGDGPPLPKNLQQLTFTAWETRPENSLRKNPCSVVLLTLNALSIGTACHRRHESTLSLVGILHTTWLPLVI